jgi:hypothetical protein
VTHLQKRSREQLLRLLRRKVGTKRKDGRELTKDEIIAVLLHIEELEDPTPSLGEMLGMED